jgi:tripartite-type tricarboxylate transporter receptor subunit TctC
MINSMRRPAMPAAPDRASNVVDRRRRAVIAATGAVAAALVPQPVLARRGGRIVVTFPAGSPPDLLARALPAALAAEGGPWRVENLPGASGTLGAAQVARARGDGRDLLIGVPATLAIASLVFERLPYDMVADFRPVAGLASGAQVLAVAQHSPVQDFTAWRQGVQARGTLARVGHSGLATSIHLQLQRWKQRDGWPLLPAAYSGVGAIVRDLLGGHVDVYAGPVGGVLEALRGQRARALAVTGPRRDPWLPQVPTLTELGQPEAIGALWTGVFAPAAEPADRVGRWGRALLDAQRNGAFSTLLRQLALAPLALPGPDFGAVVQADRERYAELGATLALERRPAG